MRRLLIGHRGSEIGAWMTVEGKDVLSGNLDINDYLIKADSQNISLLMNGVVSVRANKSVNVFFPEDIGERPVVLSSMSVNDLGWVPSFVNYKFKALGDQYETVMRRTYRLGSRYRIQPNSDRIVVTNRTTVDFNVRYGVFMSGLQ